MSHVIPQGPELLQQLRLKKYGGGLYSVRYLSYLTGKLVHIPVKKSGQFASKEAAIEWAEGNLRLYMVKEIEAAERHEWRTNAKIVQLYCAYAEWRKEDQPRSAQQDLSMLVNFGLPFFVSVMKLQDPNEWHNFGEELLEWLKKEAKTKKGEPLAVSSANKVINSLNHFCRWLKRKKHIEYNNCRDFEAFDQRKINRRSSDELVTPEIFEAVYNNLLRMNPLYAEMWLVQRRLGFRVNELLGLPFNWLSDKCPEYLGDAFKSKGLKVFGSMYLESQPALPYIKRVKGVIERAPLKWRKQIGTDFARTIPIVSLDAWNVLVRRYNEQCDLWDKQVHGPYKESYLLFDGAQRNKYLEAIREGYKSLGIEPSGSHILRHTLSTEWTGLGIDQKVAELALGHKEAAHARYVLIVGQVNAQRQQMAPMQRLKVA